jgi:glutathione synthase/RimK-type ligase-like ATP-grasp enzyme
MRIAIASSKAKLPPSDQALLESLAGHGITVDSALWTSSDVDWRIFDCVLVRSCWDYHLRVDDFRGWLTRLEGSGAVVLNPLSLIRWNLNKRYLKELSRAGVSIPPTVWIEPAEEFELAAVCRSHGWKSAVVKPLISASAHGAERRMQGPVRGPAMIQEYLASIRTEGEWSLMYFGGRFSHAVRKMPRDGDFRVQAEFGGTVEAVDPDQPMLAFAGLALTHLPELAAIARVDVLPDGRRHVLMELEVIEPELFLESAPGAKDRAASAVLNAIARATPRPFSVAKPAARAATPSAAFPTWLLP